MFCDLVDSTALSVRFDPEDLRTITREFQECCERVVQKYGGKVARYMGDGLLVYFGYPTASEHDPENAVRAGREITAIVPQLELRQGLTLHVRVGIATGAVVVGDLIGRGPSQEQAVVGETPNLAKRLQALAAPDGVVISEATKRLVGGLFEYVDLGLHSLKGFDVPALALGRSARSRRRKPLCGVALSGQAEHARRPRPGNSAVAASMARRDSRRGACRSCSVGEAGIGKSRLTLHFASRWRRRLRTLCWAIRARLTTRKAPCFRSSTTWSAARAFIAATVSTPSSTSSRPCSSQYSRIAPTRRSTLPLLGLPAEHRYAPLDVAPRLLKERTFAALEQQLAAVAAEQPVLMVFEDLHWVDPTTLELLDRTVRRVDNTRWW